MAVGWAKDGAVQDQIDDTISDAVKAARAKLASGLDSRVSATHCEECGEPIPEPRRLALPGVRRCVVCQSAHE